MKRLLISAALAFGLIGGAANADDAACQKVRFADVGWTDIQVTTGVAQVLLEALGYEPEVNTLAVPVTYASLKSKDLDVFLGNWMPSMTADVTPYIEDKSVELIAVNLDDAGYGLVVPQYVADAGVKSLKDLGAHKDQFGGKIYGIEAGNDGNRIISGMIAKPENNLAGFELVESSEAGMLTQAEKAMKNNDWIVFLGWTPHPVMGEMKIAYLDGMGDFRIRRREGLHQRTGRPAPAVPKPRPTPQEPQVQPRHGRCDDGARAQGRRGPQGNGSGLAQGQPGRGEAMARGRQDLRRQRWTGGRAGCSKIISSL